MLIFFRNFLALGAIFISVACDARAGKDTQKFERITQPAHTVEESFSQKKAFWVNHKGSWIWANGVVTQRATDHYFPLMLREKEQFTTLDISVRFKPLSGQIDASGGVVFRAQDADNYYIVRANALENNYRLYTFKQGNRRQIASATVTPPALGQWHTMRVVALGDHIQAYLDGTLWIDHHDSSYAKGYIGLWTKADSVTAFDDLRVLGE